MGEKVLLPKEIAEAIVDVRKFYRDSEIIATIENDRGCSVYGTEMFTLVKYHRKNDGNINLIMQALVNGYEVEKTPEENVREYYTMLVTREAYLENSGVHGGQHRQGWQSVVETLNILGIKIEGVND